MKLHRFTAINNQKAILKIHQALGPDALIYSTRTIPNGVEILAGLPYNADMPNDSTTEWMSDFSAESMTQTRDDQHHDLFSKAESNLEIVDKLNAQLQRAEERLEKLSKLMDTRFLENLYVADDELMVRKNLLFFHLSKLGFRGRFCNQFVTNYLRQRRLGDNISQKNIETALLKYIKTPDKELIAEKNICAFIGPTGAGKTTSIAKIANRYIAQYGAEGLGLITLDSQDVSSKNHLLYYGNLFNADLEYANNPKELSLILKSMCDKKLILIDTCGVNHRNQVDVRQVLDLIESQGGKISCYLTIPCNIQEPILDEIVRAFCTPNLTGCILTKQDESISAAPALSISLNYKLPISYICHGRNIHEDITVAEPEKILQHITVESIETKVKMEELLDKNLERVLASVEES